MVHQIKWKNKHREATTRAIDLLTNISEAKEHSTNGGFLCEEKQAIQTSKDISEAHEEFYKAILKRYK